MILKKVLADISIKRNHRDSRPVVLEEEATSSFSGSANARRGALAYSGGSSALVALIDTIVYLFCLITVNILLKIPALFSTFAEQVQPLLDIILVFPVRRAGFVLFCSLAANFKLSGKALRTEDTCPQPPCPLLHRAVAAHHGVVPGGFAGSQQPDKDGIVGGHRPAYEMHMHPVALEIIKVVHLPAVKEDLHLAFVLRAEDRQPFDQLLLVIQLVQAHPRQFGDQVVPVDQVGHRQ